jgi:8-oxo-dGTP diphosphatase
VTTVQSAPQTVPKKGRFKAIVDVHLLLIKDDELLLGIRKNTGYGDGTFHPPAGHLEADESVIDALVREAQEEIGVTIAPESVRLAHVMHNASGDGRVAFFLEVKDWQGEVTNLEPEKCEEWRWVPLANLPDHMIDYARSALTSYTSGELLSMYGW